MVKSYAYHSFPASRIASIDIYSVGQMKHHVSALLELDVTDSRARIRDLRRGGYKITFNSWLIKVISKTLEEHSKAAAFLKSRKKLIVFRDINISVMVEKILDGKRIPMPLLIKKTNEKSASDIAREIEAAKNQLLTEKDIVLGKQSGFYEKLYYGLPGFIRRAVWRFILRHPTVAYNNMGNAIVTSLGMTGIVNGWFIHKSIHPVSFGVGSVIKKPVVFNDEIRIREILNMTLLMDHDVIDGAPMVRFVKDLTKNIEGGCDLFT